jgi:hypothetical protein
MFRSSLLQNFDLNLLFNLHFCLYYVSFLREAKFRLFYFIIYFLFKLIQKIIIFLSRFYICFKIFFINLSFFNSYSGFTTNFTFKSIRNNSNSNIFKINTSIYSLKKIYSKNLYSQIIGSWRSIMRSTF